MVVSVEKFVNVTIGHFFKYAINKGMVYLIGTDFSNLFNTYGTVHW